MTKRVLVTYGSKHGATKEIAEAIGRELVEAGLGAEVRPAREVRELDPYDAVVIGSAVYMARWRRDALRLLRRRSDELAQRDVWVFSSGPVGEVQGGEAESRWTRPKPVDRAAEEIGAHEHVVFGGRVSDDAGSFMRRNMAKNTPIELRDRRDWDEIRAWSRKIASTLRAPGPAPRPAA